MKRTEDDHGPRTMHRAGWRRRIETTSGMVETDHTEWLCLTEVFRDEVCKGFRSLAVLRLLDKRGHVAREKGNEFNARVQVPGLGKVQVYIVRSTLLDEADA